MKRIGVISDTHGTFDDVLRDFLRDVDEIWHAGDIGSMEVAEKFEAFKPFRAVYGNIDGQDLRQVYPENNRFTVEGLDVLMTHIGGYPGRYDPRIRSTLFTNPPKIFISGHSHILKVMFDKKIQTLHMNPGAAGIYGFHQVRTLLRFVVDDGDIRDLEVIELGKR